MTDSTDAPPPWGPSDGPSEGPWGPLAAPWTPPPPPDGFATPAPPPRRRPVGIVAVTVTVVLALVAGVAAVIALTGPATNTPEDAVRGLLDAAGNGDVLGVLDHIDPAERGAITDFLTNGTQDLARLGVLDPGIDLHHVAGVAATFTVETAHTDLRPGLATVEITGGTVRSHVDASRLPLGPFVRQHAASALDQLGVKDTTSPVHVTWPIATVQRGGTWYVSLGYTVAEAARHRANLPLPDPAASVPAVGASSPEGAVDAFLHAAAALDVQRLIELTPPDEMGALHDYAPLFLPKVTDALSHAPSHSISITSLALSHKPHADGELVTVTSIGVHASVNGTTIDFAPGSRCPTVTGSASADFSAFCDGSAPATSSQLPQAWSDLVQSLRAAKPDLGFVVVQRAGSWYVSPTRSMLDDLEAVLHAVPPDLLTKLAGVFNASSIIGSASSRLSTSLPPGLHCVNGVATMTVPSVPGRPSLPPLTIPCPPGQ